MIVYLRLLKESFSFDELYSGTNPYEAIGSAYAFLTYLNKYDNVTFMLTTHFLDLCKRLDTEPKVLNCNMVINTRASEAASKAASAAASEAASAADTSKAASAAGGTSKADASEAASKAASEAASKAASEAASAAGGTSKADASEAASAADASEAASAADASEAASEADTSENYIFEYTYKLQKGISHIKGGVKVLKDLDYPKEIIENTTRIIKELTL